jgi:hypothetical protein
MDLTLFASFCSADCIARLFVAFAPAVGGFLIRAVVALPGLNWSGFLDSPTRNSKDSQKIMIQVTKYGATTYAANMPRYKLCCKLWILLLPAAPAFFVNGASLPSLASLPVCLLGGIVEESAILSLQMKR